MYMKGPSSGRFIERFIGKIDIMDGKKYYSLETKGEGSP